MFSLSLISGDFNVYCYDRRDGGMSPMDEHERLAECFDEHRPRLRAVAYRMLGSLSEADDAVEMDILADPARLRQLDLTALDS
jgi:hypothetical protein